MKYLYLLFGTIVGGLTVYYALNNYNLRKADMIVTPVTTLHGDVKSSIPTNTLISNNRVVKGKFVDPERTAYQFPVYDLTFTAYSQQFADQFASDDANVTNMDKGLHFVEIKMITEGNNTVCYYKFALDKDINLAFPKQDFLHHSRDIRPHVTIATEKDNHSKKMSRDYAFLYAGKEVMNDMRFWNKTHLGNPDYQFNASGEPFSKGSIFDVFVIYYYPNRAGYQLLSTQRLCGGGQVYNFPNPSFWVQKEGANERTTLPQKHNYHMFAIPQTIIDRFQPYLYEFEKNKYPQ